MIKFGKVFGFIVILCMGVLSFKVSAYIATAYEPNFFETHGELYGRVIILDAGHGFNHTARFHGYDESERMLHLTLALERMLAERGATVLLTRRNRYYVEMPVRVASINKWALESLRKVREEELASLPELCTAETYEVFSRLLMERFLLEDELQEICLFINAMERVIHDPYTYGGTYFNLPFDLTRETPMHPYLRRIFDLKTASEIRDNFLVISLHSNATPRPICIRANGADAYIMTNDDWRSVAYFANYKNVCRSYHFSDILLDGIHSIGIQRRDVKPGNWAIIREHNLPGVLVENGFHTNAHDRALLLCNMFMDRLAQVYVAAITRYFQNPDEIATHP